MDAFYGGPPGRNFEIYRQYTSKTQMMADADNIPLGTYVEVKYSDPYQIPGTDDKNYDSSVWFKTPTGLALIAEMGGAKPVWTADVRTQGITAKTPPAVEVEGGGTLTPKLWCTFPRAARFNTVTVKQTKPPAGAPTGSFIENETTGDYSMDLELQRAAKFFSGNDPVNGEVTVQGMGAGDYYISISGNIYVATNSTDVELLGTINFNNPIKVIETLYLEQTGVGQNTVEIARNGVPVAGTYNFNFENVEASIIAVFNMLSPNVKTESTNEIIAVTLKKSGGSITSFWFSQPKLPQEPGWQNIQFSTSISEVDSLSVNAENDEETLKVYRRVINFSNNSSTSILSGQTWLLDGQSLQITPLTNKTAYNTIISLDVDTENQTLTFTRDTSTGAVSIDILITVIQ